MLTQETLAKIYHCQREIKVANELIAKVTDLLDKESPNYSEGKLKDAWGRSRGFELAVPSGETAHRLYELSPNLALSIIRAHIANKEAELVEWNEIARNELGIANVKETA